MSVASKSEYFIITKGTKLVELGKVRLTQNQIQHFFFFFLSKDVMKMKLISTGGHWSINLKENTAKCA